MSVRVLLLTQWFDPEPTFKGIVFARELARQGFDVTVLTGFPNYPGGKLYAGYRVRFLQEEWIDGVRVVRVPLYPSHDRSPLKRALNYLSFAASSFVYGLGAAKRVDVIYAYHPPLTVGITAGLLRLLRRTPVVYDIQDMWPDTLRATGMLQNHAALRIIDAVCGWVYRRVDHLTVLSPGFQRLLCERGVPAQKIDVIYNWADEHSLTAPTGELPTGFPECDRFRIMFAGNMGKAQALLSVLDAAAILQERGTRVTFVMIGGGIEVAALKARARELRLENLIFLPPVPMTEIGTMLAAADALLVHLRKDPLFSTTIPSKTQAYMAVGKPLLMAVDGDAAHLVENAAAGLVARSEEPQSIADAAECLAAMPAAALQTMGDNARNYYRTHLSLQVGVAKFGAIFDKLAGKTPSAKAPT